MSTLAVILAWAGGQAVFDRNLPYWERLNVPLLVASPSDSQVQTKYAQIALGPHSYAGVHSHTRLSFLISFLAGLQYDGYALFEYDSLCLLDRLEIGPGMHGILQTNLEGDKFLCDKFANPPWTMDAWGMARMARVAARFPQVTEGGWDDRLFSAWAQIAGVPLSNFPEGGFTRGTIESKDFQALAVAIARGVRWIHGVKSPETQAAVAAALKASQGEA